MCANRAHTESLKTRVELTDALLVVLDGSDDPEVQAKVDAAKARIAAAERFGSLPEALAGLVADVVTEARENGLLRYTEKNIRSCDYCDDKPYSHYHFKSGRRAGQPNYNRPKLYRGVEFADRFITMQNHVTLGGCKDCVALAIPALKEALKGVPAQVPAIIRAEGEPERIRYDNRVCTKCGWEGHEGQMGKSRTLMNDGWYPSSCPNPDCGAYNRFGITEIKHRDGFVVIEKEQVKA